MQKAACKSIFGRYKQLYLVKQYGIVAYPIIKSGLEATKPMETKDLCDGESKITTLLGRELFVVE